MKAFRQILLVAVPLLLLCQCNRQSYDGVRAGVPQYEEYAGVYRLYPAVTYDRGEVPAGYKPFHISHYGRHGSRYILYDSQYLHVSHVLKKAFQDGRLTPLGLGLKEKYDSIFPLMMGRAGDLTKTGQAQHNLIAKRMYEEYPEIFRKNPEINAVSTLTYRTIMSMAAFCEGLKESDPELEISQDASVAALDYLNPYSAQSSVPTEADLLHKSKNASWRPAFESYMQSVVDVGPFTERIFSDEDYAREICNPLDFMRDLYSVAVHLQGTPMSDVSFAAAFTDDEMSKLWECDNIIFYIEKGLGLDDESYKHGPLLAENILSNIISEADMAIGSDRPSVSLRFGHDGCLMGLYTLMKLDCWNGKTEDYAGVKDVFQSWRIPMAANFQLVLFRNTGKEDILVKLFLNEEVHALPLEEVADHCYRWEDFKRLYVR